MTDETIPQAVETPAPDANATPPVESVAAPSPAVEDTDEPALKGVSKRIDELTRNWREAERREARLIELLAHRESPQRPQAEAPKPSETPKTLADFDYDEVKYQSYVFQQAEKLSAEAARRELSAHEERQAAERRKSTFTAKETAFAKTVDDYREVAYNPSLRITQAMADAIADSDEGPALAYHLGKNPDVAAQLAQLPPIVAAREIGKIEAALSYAREEAKRKTVSATPPPPPKVEGTDSAVNIRPDSPDSDKLSADEWLKKRNKQLERKKA